MSRAVLVLRPERGASETAARARALGLAAVTAPLFVVAPLAWQAPDPAGFDAVLLTSANAARHGGSGLDAFTGLPCFAVGEATGAAAREAGFRDVRTGAGDGAEAVATMVEAGMRSAFHPCGRDHLPLDHPRLPIERRTVYAADGVEALPAAAVEALAAGALALVHSPRAGALLAALVDAAGLARADIAIAAISEAAAAAAGGGWASVAAAPRPRDEALLAIAAKLCQTPRFGAQDESDHGRL